MLELLVTLGFIATMAAFVMGVQLLSVGALLSLGILLVGGGFGVGLPASAVYHALLRRSLLRANALPPRWYWRPISLHPQIPSPDRFVVLAWCYLGAAGFFAIVLGCAVVALAAWRSA